MRIRLFTPIDGWRKFLGEIGVVVLGVVIALAAGEVVETIHGNNEVASAKEALRAELNHNLGAIAFLQNQQACLDQRLDEIESWAKSWRGGSPRALDVDGAGPEVYTMHSSVWEVIKTGQTASRMSLMDKLDYARIYDDLQTVSTSIVTERQAWRTIAEISFRRRLDDAAIGSVLYNADLVRRAGSVYSANLDEMGEAITRLRLKPDTLKAYFPERARRLCETFRPARAEKGELSPR
jgi:hypothetical protein